MRSPIPLWPGRCLPQPFTVRWTADAWEALYPPGCRAWKPWPWEAEERERIIAEKLNAPWIPQTIRDSWQAIKEAR